MSNVIYGVTQSRRRMAVGTYLIVATTMMIGGRYGYQVRSREGIQQPIFVQRVPVIMNIAADNYRIASIALKGSVKKIWAIRDLDVSKREVK